MINSARAFTGSISLGVINNDRSHWLPLEHVTAVCWHAVWYWTRIFDKLTPHPSQERLLRRLILTAHRELILRPLGLLLGSIPASTMASNNTTTVKIHCVVKGYQECRFTVTSGERFQAFRKHGSQGRAFKVVNTRGQLGHLQRELVTLLWPFKDGFEW